MKIFKKKALRIIGVAVVALIVIGTVVLWNMDKTTSVDFKYDAAKLDKDGKEIGSEQIHISGNYYDYLFREDRLELSVDPFDGLENISIKDECDYVYFPEQDIGYICFDAYNSFRSHTETLYLLFDAGFDHLLIQRRGEICYTGSASGKYTPQECTEHFNNITDEKDFVLSTPIALSFNVEKMTRDGGITGEFKLQITGYYRNYLLKADRIYLEIGPFDEFAIIHTGTDTEVWLWDIPMQNVAYGEISLGTFIASDKMPGLRLLFTGEYDRFIIISEDKEYFYIGSVSEKYTSREIVEYFNSFYNTGITLPEA